MMIIAIIWAKSTELNKQEVMTRTKWDWIFTRFRDNREFSIGVCHFLSIARLLGRTLGLFKPDGIEFG